MATTVELSGRTRVLNVIRQVFRLLPLERLLAKLTTGRDSRSLFGRMVPNHYQYAPETFRTVNNGSLTFHVDISEYVGHYLYFGFRDGSLDALYDRLNRDDVVLDVGANIGVTVLRMAQALSNTGQVIGFEPDPYNYRRLQHNVGLNCFSNVKTLNYGLGETSADVKLAVDAGNRGANHIDSHATNNFSVIRVRPLDDVVRELQLQRVDVIKIDVEGFEMNVLRGAVDTLHRFRPLLFIELDDENLRAQGSSAQALIEYLNDAGYTHVLRADTDMPLHVQTEYSRCHYDIICFAAP